MDDKAANSIGLTKFIRKAKIPLKIYGTQENLTYLFYMHICLTEHYCHYIVVVSFDDRVYIIAILIAFILHWSWIYFWKIETKSHHNYYVHMIFVAQLVVFTSIIYPSFFVLKSLSITSNFIKSINGSIDRWNECYPIQQRLGWA